MSIIPQIVNVELNNRCNLKCIFCDHPVLKHTMRIDDFDTKLLEKVLQSYAPYSVYELGLVGLGEPLLDTYLEQHLDIISNYKDVFTRISMNTNGLALSEAKGALILHSNVNLITFSLNATNKFSYCRLMGKDLFDTVVNNIKRFIVERERANRTDLDISIQYMSSELNDNDEMRDIFDGFLGNGVEIYNRYVFNKPVLDGKSISSDLNFEEFDEIRYPCWSLYSRVYIDINGNVYPCTIGNDCYRETSCLNIGNVYSQDIIDIFTNSNIVEARVRSEEGKVAFPECRHCTVWNLLPNNFLWNGNQWIPNDKKVLRKEELKRRN